MKSVDDDPMNRKTLKTSEIPEVEEALLIWFEEAKGEIPEVEEALLIWFKQQRNQKAPRHPKHFETKSPFFYHEISKKTDFRASHGWFQNFKKRHGIRYMQRS
ncbi:Tc5 transposase DNA-binding domain [Popillia japonica]|uniref:Tc5 transposase DNA-binding domain n=1 Tax=Popillia japonica TaxID=7064 RepID=A0AAW1ISY2_POPJA